METSTVLMGSEVVSIRTFGGPKKERPLRYVNSNWVSVRSGEEFVVDVDGYPIIVATVDSQMILGHAEDVSVVDDIIHEFLARGIAAERIVMCMQFASDESRESAFIDQAYQAGLRYIWAMNSLAEYSSLDQGPQGRDFIVVKRR